jgi:N utilization substance protein B
MESSSPNRSRRVVKKQLERSKARQQALQILFQSDIRSCAPSQVLSEGTALVASSDGDAASLGCDVDDFTRELVEGVETHERELDRRLGTIAENWSLSRMSAVDRNILRIALFELAFEPDIPESVSINEAVEMAKLFGGEESSRFVNGVLGRAARGSGGEEDS